MKRLGDGRPTDHGPTLEDDDPQSGARQIEGADQTIVPAADDDGVRIYPRHSTSDGCLP